MRRPECRTGRACTGVARGEGSHRMLLTEVTKGHE